MHTFKRYLHAKCRIPVLMHKEEADKRSGGFDLVLINGVCRALSFGMTGTLGVYSKQVHLTENAIL